MATEESKQILCWREIVQEEKACEGDPVHAGDSRAKGGGLTGMSRVQSGLHHHLIEN